MKKNAIICLNKVLGGRLQVKKGKLTIDGQIVHMKDNGITFNIVTEEDAKEFLLYNNYYFKIKSYAKNYDKYEAGENIGKYINLDFAYIKELSTVDMYIRQFVMKITLSIEHFLKTQMLRDFINNRQEDGYAIIEEFLDEFPSIRNNIDMKQSNSACTDLITKYNDNFAIWNIVEVLSFGDFIKLYNKYYKKYPSELSMTNYLWSVKFLRNAAAHNNCLINSLKTPYIRPIKPNKQVNTFISKIPGIKRQARVNKMSNHVIHDFIVTLFVFNGITTSIDLKRKTFEELKRLFDERLLSNKSYFEKNEVIKSNYKFLKIIIDYFNDNCI